MTRATPGGRGGVYPAAHLFPRGRNLAWLLLVLWMGSGFLWGCTPEPQPLVFGAAVWRDGETSTYRVTNREGQVVGSATTQVLAGGERNQEGGWTVRREINDVGITENAFIEVQPNGFRPVYSLLVRTDGAGSQLVETTIDRNQVDIALTNRAGATVYERTNVPSDIRDERTLTTIVRALPLAEGYATRLNSFLPVTGRSERLTVQVRGSEQVSVPAGTYDTWVVELKTQDRTTRAWVGKEAPHPVVKLVDGRSQATFELTQFSPDG